MAFSWKFYPETLSKMDQAGQITLHCNILFPIFSVLSTQLQSSLNIGSYKASRLNRARIYPAKSIMRLACVWYPLWICLHCGVYNNRNWALTNVNCAGMSVKEVGIDIYLYVCIYIIYKVIFMYCSNWKMVFSQIILGEVIGLVQETPKAKVCGKVIT